MLSVDEQVRMLRERQQAEMDLLLVWWQAKLDCEEAQAAVDRLVTHRDWAVSRILGGMTAKQQSWVQRHLTYATRPRDRTGRYLVQTWVWRHARAEACEAEWAARIAPAEQALSAAQARLAGLAPRVLRRWGQARCEEMTGDSWQRVATLARRSAS